MINEIIHSWKPFLHCFIPQLLSKLCDLSCDLCVCPHIYVLNLIAPSCSCLHAPTADFGIFEACFGVPLGFLHALGSKTFLLFLFHIHNSVPYKCEFHTNTKVGMKTFHWKCGKKCRSINFPTQWLCLANQEWPQTTPCVIPLELIFVINFVGKILYLLFYYFWQKIQEYNIL